MWKYKKVVIESVDYSPKDIIKEMNFLGADGWEIFSISEKEEITPTYGDNMVTTYYTLFMKRKEELYNVSMPKNPEMF